MAEACLLYSERYSTPKEDTMGKTFYIYSAEERKMFKAKAQFPEQAILSYIKHLYASDPEELSRVLKDVRTSIAINSWAQDFGLVVTSEEDTILL